MSSTLCLYLAWPERRIGQCWEATRAPTQGPRPRRGAARHPARPSWTSVLAPSDKSMLHLLFDRESTDCYTWPDRVGRHTLVDAALSRAIPKALGSLSPETNLPVQLGLIVLCAGESSPGADGLLCGQRSCETFWPHNKRPLFFQNRVDARRQFTSYRHDSFARGYLFRMAMVDAPIESAQLGILLDGGPGALNQLVAQPLVARAGDAAAILFFSGGVFARHQPQETGNLPNVGNLTRVAQAPNQMGSYDPADPRKALEEIARLPQFGIIQAVAPNLFRGRGRRQKMKLHAIDQIIQLKAHRFRARQSLQLAHRPRRPFLLRIGKSDPFIEQQRLDAQLAGRQLLHVRVAQLHQVAQVAIRARGHVNAVQLSAPQTFRELLAVEPIGLHAFSWRPRHFRGRRYQASIIVAHQLVVQTKAGGPGFVGKRHPLLWKMLPHVFQQGCRTVGHAQRAHQSFVIGKNHCHALLVYIEPREDVVIAGNKPGNLSLNCHRRFSWSRLLNRAYSRQPT